MNTFKTHRSRFCPSSSRGRFVVDGGTGIDAAMLVQQAVANGDPLAFTDGSGQALQLFEVVTDADIAAFVTAKNSSLVYDPATYSWEDPNGVCPTIEVCLETEIVCGLFDTSSANISNAQNILLDITGEPGNYNFSSAVGRPFDLTALVTNTADGSPASITGTGGQAAGTDITWDVSAPFAPASEEAEGCKPVFLQNSVWVIDIDDDQTFIEILNPDDIESVTLTGALLQDPDNVNPNIYRLPTDGTFAPGAANPNTQFRAFPIAGRSVKMRVVSGSGSDSLVIRNYVRTVRAASCLSLCGSVLSGVDSNGVALTADEIAEADKDSGFDVVLVVLQSNAVGSSLGPIDPVLDASDPRIFERQQDGSVVIAEEALDHVVRQDQSPGFPLTFARNHLASLNPNRNVLLVPMAQGGTGHSSNNWNPGNARYNAAVTATNAALAEGDGNNQIVAILAQGGERDSNDGSTQAQHEVAFDAMIAGFRSEINGAENVPVIVGDLAPNFAGGTHTQIRASLADLPNRVANTAWVSSAGLTDRGDNVHFDAPSLRTLGDRYYAAFSSI